jgi:hypothetical protein
MIDAERFAADLYASMKMLIDRRECALTKRIEALEARQADINPDAIADNVRKAIPAGKDGRDGKDAPAIDVEALFARLKEAIPAPLKGEPGKDGRDGANGKDGAPGVDGKDGRDGISGKDGAPGTDGRDGVNGKDGADVDPLILRGMVVGAVAEVVKELPAPKDGRDGRDGKDGIDGEPGRDASAIDYVQFDPTKSYPLGTHALCRGGILYAERTTDRVEGNDFKAAGWRHLVAGLADVRMEILSDGRTFQFALEYSDGRTEKLQAKAAVPAHRGVWRESVTYEKGDVVQWSGNGWIAREVTTDKPGEAKSWDLLARRGRDGKDA